MFIRIVIFAGVREKLLESEDHMCPQCKETGVSPDSLIPNTYLRKLVINFENETGYIKPAHRSSSGAGGDAFRMTSQHHAQPRSSASGAYGMQQQHNAVSRPSPTSQYAPTSTPMSMSQAPQPVSQQLPTSIPASLIGLPPHVIKAHLREMEKARQSARAQNQQNVQQQYAMSAPSTNSYPQSSQRMADNYPSHQSQSGMMMSQRQTAPPMLSSSNTAVSRPMA